MRALPEAEAGKRLFLPFGTPPTAAKHWRDSGWITIAGLEPGNAAAEAKRLACTHVLVDGTSRDINQV